MFGFGRLMRCENRSRIYVEGEPSINKYLDKDGNQQSSLKIIQRKCSTREPGRLGLGLKFTKLMCR